MLLYGNNKNQNVLQFGGLYTHAKFQVILLVNFKDMSNFNTCGRDTAQERKSLSKIGSRHLS